MAKEVCKSFKTKLKLCCCVSTVLYSCGAVACYSIYSTISFCTDSLSLNTNTREFALKVAIQTELLALSVVLAKNCESFLTWNPRETVVDGEVMAGSSEWGMWGWCVSVDNTCCCCCCYPYCCFTAGKSSRVAGIVFCILRVESFILS